MYEKRFGLHRKPFQSVLSDHDFYQSETFREILPGMLHALRSDLGVAVLTGPAGVGKSVTLEAVRRKLEGNCQAILVRGGTVKSAGDLLFLLHRSLLKCQGGGDAKGTDPSDTVRRWEVMERLQRVAEFWGPLVVLLDDAHLVEADVFAELRALLEEELDGQKLVRLLITGPLVLEEVLAEPGHADFAQKIRTHVFLQPLSSVESVQFLSHNISNAGGELSAVMENSAIERIVAAADGVPRCLNLLADESLIVCEESQEARATRASVDKALKRLQHLPYAWNVSLYDDSEDDDDFGMEESGAEVNAVSVGTDSVVEFGSSSDTVVDSSPGVIEIGGSPSSAKAARAPELKPEPLVHGVIEIGAPAASSVTAAVASQPSVVEVADVASVIPESVSCDAESIEVGADVSDEFIGCEIEAETFFAEDEADSYENEGKLAALLANVSLEDETLPLAIDDASGEGCDAQNSTLTEVSLEHHLLLAGSGDEADCGDTTVTGAGESGAVAEASAEVAEQATDSEVALDGYSRWEPAGEWPVEVSGGDVSSAEDSLTEIDVLESIAVEPLRPNAKPVFDRYTWCELGRSVTPLQRNRMDLATSSSPSVWPPVTDGIAPTNAIPLETIHEDYADLLTDLGVIVNDASQAVAPVSDSTSDADGSCANFLSSAGEASPVTNGWDAAIDEIQNLIDVEQSADSDGCEMEGTAEGTAEGGPGWGGEQMLVGEGLSNFESPFSVPPLDEDAAVGDDGELDPESGAAESSLLGPDESEAIATVSEVSAEEVLHDGQLLCEERRVGDFVAEDEEQQRYVPRLMQQARQLGLSQTVSGGRLRYAAGAESYEGLAAETTDADAKEENGDVSVIRLVMADDGQLAEEVEAGESTAEGGRFLNLFTKLRKLRKTSA